MARQFNANAGAFGTSSSNHIRRCVAATLVLSSGLAGTAFAQSTGTEILEEELTEVTVTASRTIVSIGNVTEQTAAKSRVTITGESLLTGSAGQTILEGLNQVPGLNFTNTDAFGSSGGNIRLRGLDGSRVSLTFDGIQLNDSGNYAVFTNQLPDNEIINSVDVNLGSTDVDSPTASATGGTIAFKTRRPAKDFGGLVVLAAGEESFRRMFGMLDTGEFGPLGTTAFISASYQNYDKFKGPGELTKKQINARIFQEFDNGNFLSLAGHFNENRNAFYRNGTAAQYAQFGREFDNLAACTVDAPTAGTADNDNASTLAGGNENPLNPAACTNYFNLRINPSDTGNLRFQSLFNLGEQFRLTVDAAYQYVLANGGGTQLAFETPRVAAAGGRAAYDARVFGAGANPALTTQGFDLNGDGDLLDNVRFYAPNNTNTNRFSTTASLIWDINESHRVRAALTHERARHRQTAEWGRVDIGGNPLNVFAGNEGDPVLTRDGALLRGRDRYSIAELNQVAAEYRGEFFDDRLVATIGVRAPRFERELNQYCHTLNGGSGNSGGVLCTTQPVFATLANGNVTFGPSIAAMGTTPAVAAQEYIAPYAATVKFDDVLPNLGLTYKAGDDHMFYVAYTEGISAPRTDNLYAVARLPDGSVGRSSPESETTRVYDLGWRYQGDNLLSTVAIWRTDYKNRIISAFDDGLGFSVDRNVGAVRIQGIDLQTGWRVDDKITLTGFVSYNDSELLDNVRASATVEIPTAGKQQVETPEWSYGGRFDIKPTEALRFGLEAKHVGDRFATDLNDEVAESYTVFDLFSRYETEIGSLQDVEFQLNVRNLFDEEYFGNINTQQNAQPFVNALNGATVTGVSAPGYALGAPRTFVFTMRVKF
jgi:iron complex outermembrane recepter protein